MVAGIEMESAPLMTAEAMKKCRVSQVVCCGSNREGRLF